MRLGIGLLAVAVLFASCGGQTADTTSSVPVSAATSSTVTTVAPAASTTVAPTTVPVDITPALGVTVSAADSFDEGFLSEGQPGFVPMDDPVMVPASEVTWLADDDVVMGVVHTSGEAQAYPVSQMAYHHIANTTVAGEPFLVTY